MRRNGAEDICINQQPVQYLTALQQPHKLNCHPSSQASPAQPSLAQPSRAAARLFVEPGGCHALQEHPVRIVPHVLNPTCW